MRTQLLIAAVVLVACSKTTSFEEIDQLIADRRAAEAAVDAGLDSGASATCEQAGEPCSAGEGQCERVGAWVCENGGARCDAEPGQPQVELCESGKDEDCDAELDEAPTGRCCSDADCSGGDVCERLLPEQEVGECNAPSADGGDSGDGDGETTAAQPRPCGGADLDNDAQNCGVCEFACQDEEACEQGKCRLHCDADLDVDPDNCGSCGRKCADGQACEGGACAQLVDEALNCLAGQKPCGTGCIDELGCCDDQDCGATSVRFPFCVADTRTCVQCIYDKDCESDSLCDEGHCVPKPVPCDGRCSLYERCVGDVCECPGSPDLQTDEDNCGECARRCPVAQECVAGRCQAFCGGANYLVDENHCGEDCVECGSSEECVLGTCVESQPAAVCGNGLVEGSEQCDPGRGPGVGTFKCSSECTKRDMYARCSGACEYGDRCYAGMCVPQVCPIDLPGLGLLNDAGYCMVLCSEDEDCPDPLNTCAEIGQAQTGCFRL